jgi:hypothetical protein
MAHWRLPNISPDFEGGVDLYWNIGSHRALLRIQPGKPSIECTTQVTGEKARVQRESPGDAIECAVWTMRLA